MSRLIEVDVTPGTELPERAAAFLADADRQLDALLAGGLRETLPCFAPSDHALVGRTFAALVDQGLRGEHLLEWGSALGEATGLASLLGFRASGIELEPSLVAASRRLLSDHGIDAEIAEGSFVPDGYEAPSDVGDPDTLNVRDGVAAYDELGRDIDDFAVVFSYPWPGDEELHFDLFAEHAATGALLVTYHGMDGVRVQRRV